MNPKIWAASAVLFGTLLTACGGGYVGAAYGPPPPRYGVVGYAPGPRYVWTEGYWKLSGGAWVWAPGRWVVPPHPHAVWVGPQWHREARGYRYYRGYWR